jgi:hypothetical protein
VLAGVPPKKLSKLQAGKADVPEQPKVRGYLGVIARKLTHE